MQQELITIFYRVVGNRGQGRLLGHWKETGVNKTLMDYQARLACKKQFGNNIEITIASTRKRA